MAPRLRVPWLPAALIAAAVAGGALPLGERSASQSPEPIGFLSINEGTTSRTASGADNVVSGLAALADGSLAVLTGSPWRTGGQGLFRSSTCGSDVTVTVPRDRAKSQPRSGAGRPVYNRRPHS